MSGVEEFSPPAASRWPGAAAGAAAGPMPRPRRGLFRKYVLALVGLVAVALLVNAGVEFWFSYRESKAALLGLQQEKANAAAQRIGEFVSEIEHQIGWTTLPLWGAAPIEQRRFDFIRLLREVPAITSLSELDGAGTEQLKVSRLAMDVVGSGADFSHAPEFTEARAHREWFGPVYFRKQSEPYMMLAMAQAGQKAGVTVAEINLKLIWDVVTGLKIGEGGYAYVVDRHGKLIADPDISRVLRDTDLSQLPQVAGALAGSAGRQPAAPGVSVAENGGGSVLSAHAQIAPLGWIVFVEVPLKQAFAPLYRSALRDGFWLVLALVGAALAGLVLARRMTGPIREMQAGAAQIGAGALDRRLDIHSGDELESLADQFNDMAGRLEASYADLEHKVEERTAELTESLEYQTATSDVLKVISRSTFDLQPVLDTLIATATRLCDAEVGHLAIRQGDVYRCVATLATEPAWAEWDAAARARDFTPGRGTIIGRTVLEGQVVHVVDVAADAEYDVPEAVTLGKVRTLLGVPMLREGMPTGVIILGRQRVEAFTERQIELVRTFADQAVIAIENARLITETREALDQQTATAEVLGVINASPGDLTPVFDAMLDKALRLCEASYGHVVTFDGEYIHIRALTGDPRLVNHFRNMGPVRPPPESVVERLLRGENVVHIADMSADAGSRVSGSLLHALSEIGGTRSLLGVALRKDDALIGAVVVYRQELRPFSDKQIALLQNFAAQAVIAIENARLIIETREALDQQTATAEVLQVINASPGDLAPVFEAMLEKGTRLCEASFGVLSLYRGDDRHEVVAMRGVPPEVAKLLTAGPAHLGPETEMGRLVHGEAVVHIPDASEDEAYRQGNPIRRALVDVAGTRTYLGMPMRKDGVLLGAFTIYRQEVRPFTDKQIALLRNFAAQAVIAMENARLIAETQEALDQQTATAEVLGVINSSPGDLKPVFDAMVEKALRLCEAAMGGMAIFDKEHYRIVSNVGPSALSEFAAQPVPTPPGGIPDRLRHGENAIQIEDISALTGSARTPGIAALVELGGARTALWVALRKDDATIGFFAIYRQEVRSFTEKQVALLRNFAAQAVIAMENARLLDEIRQRQAELRVTFDNMADGVVMFDAALHLAAWNRNFQEIIDLPDEFFAAPHHFDDYIRFLAERGEFGRIDPASEIARLTARFGDHYSFERTRPDGRVIEVRHNPMPEGGFVLIYSDITDRKRSEAEIRAARDAAEKALGDLKTAQASLIQAEKMASLGQLTAGIAHEIKNPLNFVNNFASLSNELLVELKDIAAPAIETLDDAARADLDETMAMLGGNLEKIAEHGRRADNIVKSMLEHSRGVSGERRAVDLNGLVEEALNLAYHGARAQDQSFNITLERDFAPALPPIELVPQDMTRVFLNLFGNGFYAANKRAQAGDGAGFRPVLRVATCAAGDAVEIRVRDNGTGIPVDVRDKLFQPFFTTKPTGEGTGLGLSISYDIVTQQHGGTIAVASEEGNFTEFTIRLPHSGRADESGATA